MQQIGQIYRYSVLKLISKGNFQVITNCRKNKVIPFCGSFFVLFYLRVVAEVQEYIKIISIEYYLNYYCLLLKSNNTHILDLF